MFKINLTLNGKHFKTLAYSKPISIKELVSSDGIAELDVITCKVDYQYTTLDHIVDKDCSLDCISYDSLTGHLMYQDTAIFILMMAYKKLFPERKDLVIEHSVGDGVFCEVFDEDLISQEDVEDLKNEMREIVKSALSIEKQVVSNLTAMRLFDEQNREDVIKNLTMNNVTIYNCGDFCDYYLRNLAENTSIIKEFDIIYHSPGLILRFPRRSNHKIIDEFILPKKLFETHQEHDKWLNILNVHNISSLNRKIKNYKVTNIIQVEEALHEKEIIDIANSISWNKNAK